jgi:hypothetical protein
LMQKKRPFPGSRKGVADVAFAISASANRGYFRATAVLGHLRRRILLGCHHPMTVTIAAAVKHELRWVRAVHAPKGILSDDFQYAAIRTLLSAVPVATQLAGLDNPVAEANPSWDASLILV